MRYDLNVEKYTIDHTHTIKSSQVLIESETGRVVAVFYNDYDLDNILNQLQEKRKLEVELSFNCDDRYK